MLRIRIKESLKQTGEVHQTKDGMDMAVCIIDREKNVINYAGAYNSLYQIRKNKLILYKADRQPIGAYSKETDFTNYYIDFLPKDKT